MITVIPARAGWEDEWYGVLEEPGEAGEECSRILFCAEHAQRPVVVIRSRSPDEVDVDIRACCGALRSRVEGLLGEGE